MRARSAAVNGFLRRTTPRPRVLAAAGAAALLSACWYPKERGQRLEERVDRVEGEGSLRAPGAGAAEAEQIRRLDARMTELQGKIDALGASAQQAGADRSARQDKVAEELSRLRATLDAHTQRLDQLERSVAERAPAAAPPAAAAATATKRREQQPPPPPPPRASPPAQAPQRSEQPVALALAREHEAKGNKVVARSIYEEYVAKFPTDPASARAHFRLGEMAYAERRYQDAIREYGRVAKDFPRSEEAPDALLRTADAMLQLKLPDEARAVLDELQRRYPASPAAQRAKERLAELGKGRK